MDLFVRPPRVPSNDDIYLRVVDWQLYLLAPVKKIVLSTNLYIWEMSLNLDFDTSSRSIVLISCITWPYLRQVTFSLFKTETI